MQSNNKFFINREKHINIASKSIIYRNFSKYSW